MPSRRRRAHPSSYAVRIAPEQLDQLKLDLVSELRPARQLGPLFSDFAARFIVWAHGERQKPSTLISKSAALRLYLMPRFQQRRLGELTDVDVHELKASLAGRAPKTVNNVLTVLRKMLRLAVRWGELDQVPVIESLKVDRPAFQFYDFEQYEQLVRGARREGLHVLTMILLGGDAGLRMGELLALERPDVDQRRREVFVRRSEWYGHVTTPKGGVSRAVPMTDLLAATLAVLPSSTARVLVRENGRSLSTETIRTWMRRAQKAAGLEVTGKLHTLRHTFCSHLAMRGAAPVAIQQLAGHTSLETTQRYMHLCPAERARTIGLLDAARSRNTPVSSRECL